MKHRSSIPTHPVTTSSGAAPVARAQLRARTRELALLEGRDPTQISQNDYEEAKRELAELPAHEPPELPFESPSEAEAVRMDSVKGSAGRQATESPSDDEDDEGRSESEQLVEGGVEKAENEQIALAARAATKAEGESQ